MGDAEGYIIAGNYPDDGLGEIFLKTSKQGSTLSGVMDAFSIAISIGLQYGVPLETYVSKFINMKFEPSGMTNDPDIRFASSLLDYVFRRLALDNLPVETREALGIRSIEERKATTQQEVAAKADTPALEAPQAESAGTPTMIEVNGASRRQDLGRPAVLPVRIEDAARGLLLRLLELRKHQRVLVG